MKQAFPGPKSTKLEILVYISKKGSNPKIGDFDA